VEVEGNITDKSPYTAWIAQKVWQKTSICFAGYESMYD